MVSEAEKIHIEILRQTERKLDAQRERATSRDQRTLVVAAFSSAFAGVAARNWIDGGQAMTGGAVAFLAASAIFAAFAALPRPIFGAGYHFKRLQHPASQVKSHAAFIASLAQMNDALIDQNDRRELVVEHCYRAALILFAIGVALAGLPFLFG